MAQWGWAYINCSSSSGGSGQAAGPTGSLQFLTGANATSGSGNLVFYTASYGGLAANTMVLTGTLIVEGTVTASSFVVDQTDVISGSTIFGNSDDDYHIRTGSFYVGNSGSSINTFQVLPASSQSVTLGMRYNYRSITSTGLTASSGDYIIGFGGSGNIEFRLLSASVAGSGSVVVIKDELTTRAGGIFISASAPNSIDNNGYYELTGTMPAISLYSNGSNWFVF
jgi:hypothetical protein